MPEGFLDHTETDAKYVLSRYVSVMKNMGFETTRVLGNLQVQKGVQLGWGLGITPERERES